MIVNDIYIYMIHIYISRMLDIYIYKYNEEKRIDA